MDWKMLQEYPRVPQSTGHFKQCKHSTLRVGDHRPAAHAFHAHRRHINLSARFPSLGGRGVAVLHHEIQQPMRRRVRVAVFGRRNAADVLVAVLDM